MSTAGPLQGAKAPSGGSAVRAKSVSTDFGAVFSQSGEATSVEVTT
jgi:hypothetical protein